MQRFDYTLHCIIPKFLVMDTQNDHTAYFIH
jgi:hypothetical protein